MKVSFLDLRIVWGEIMEWIRIIAGTIEPHNRGYRLVVGYYQRTGAKVEYSRKGGYISLPEAKNDLDFWRYHV